MSRDILFRGLSIDGEEWVYGTPYFLNIQEDEPEDCVNKACMIKYVDWDGTCGFMSPENRAFVEIKPKTVGQFTGLIDKNGTKIFEGDIINVEPFLKDGRFETVKYMFHSGYVSLHPFQNDGYHWSSFDSEIIGNIHES